MAANYSATIQLIVEGQQKLDKLQNQVTALNKQIKELARLDIGGMFEDPLMGGAVAKLRAVRNEQAAASKQAGQQQDALNRKLENQLLNQIRLNSAVDLYQRRLNEVSRTAAPGQEQFKGRLEELGQAFQFFKGKGSVTGVQAVATELGRIVEYSREVTRLEIGRAKSSQQIKDYTAQIEKLKTAGLDTLKAETTLEKFAINAGTNKYKLAEKYKIVLDSRLKNLTEELRLQKDLAAAEARRGREAGGRASGAVSSAIIGGGFPLLFGQGPAAAVGGALGGAAGGLLGGGFGFALSIAGTAIGDLITQSETLNKTLAALNSSLSSTGAASTTTASDIKQLAKDLSITNEEATQLVGTFSQFGDAQTREALASLFGGVGGAATFEAIARAGIDEKNALSSVFELRKVIGNEAATQLALQLDTVGATQAQATLLKLVVERSIQNSVATAKNVQFTDNLLSTWENIVAGVAGALSLAIQFIQKMREGSLLRLPFLDQIAALLGGVKARSGKQIAEERGSPVEKRLRAEIKAALDAVKKETSVLGTQNALQTRAAGSGKAARDAARLAEQQKEQLRSAKDLVSKKQSELKLTAATSAEEKLRAKYEATRTDRMQNYSKLLSKSLSDAERTNLVEAQGIDIKISRLEYEKELLAIRGEFDRSAAFVGAGKKGFAFDPTMNLVPSITGGELGAQAEAVRLELEKLISPVEQLKTAAEGIGTAFADSFKAAVSGAMTAQEALASFFQSVADRFLDMAAQIIAKWIEMTILNTALSLFPGGGLFKGAGPVSGAAAFSGAGMGSKGFSLPSLLPGRAAGGSVTGGSPYMVGERGPELFVPGRSGTIVPNNALGGDNVNVVVNVDASGSKVQGDNTQAGQLGRVVSNAVQQELIKQKRPGGLLA